MLDQPSTIGLDAPPLEAVPRRRRPRHVRPVLDPHHVASAFMRLATRLAFPPWKNWQIDWFVRRYGVDLGEAAEPDPRRYRTFDEFFTRRLRPDARPIASPAAGPVAPADGRVAQVGLIDDGHLLQVKGVRFRVLDLLGGGPRDAWPFRRGAYLTVYLSPRDYHRVHMPADGDLRCMVHVPGRLFSVGPRATETVPGLFARNERVVSIFDTPCGPMAMVMVGAMFVGSIEQAWAGVVTPPRGRRSRRWSYAPGAVRLARGEEMGCFHMGSTVIVLFADPGLRWDENVVAGAPLRVGEPITRREPEARPPAS